MSTLRASLVALIAASCADSPHGQPPLAESVAPLAWSEGQKLDASRPSLVGGFGTALALSGNTALVGASEVNLKGAVYVLARTDEGWVEQQKLVVADIASETYFGEAVALSGDTALIGAMEDSQTEAEYEGAAYVFQRHGESFAEVQKLKATDRSDGAFFGKSTALQSDTAVIGSNQGAYVFVRDGGGTFKQQQKLDADEFEFGQQVALDGDTALVGSWGAAIVYVREGESWRLQQKLTPEDGENQYFGTALAISGDRALIGARIDANNDLSHPGSAYLFERHGVEWQQVQKLESPSDTGDWFGVAVALSGERALIGADYDNGGGAAHVYVRGDGGWTHERTFSGADKTGNGYFGSSVALNGRDAFVGSPGTRVADLNQAGVAYAYWLHDAAPELEPTGAAGASGGDGGVGVAGAGAGAPTANVDSGSMEKAEDGGIELGNDTDRPAGGGASNDADNAACDASDTACGTGQGAAPRENASPAPQTTTTEGGWGFGCSVGITPNHPNAAGWHWVAALLAAAALRRRSAGVRRTRAPSTTNDLSSRNTTAPAAVARSSCIASGT
jgi:hypothetical protein